MQVGLMARSTESLVTQEKSQREVVSLWPEDAVRLGEDSAIPFFDGEMEQSLETARDEYVLRPHVPTAVVLVFFLTCLYRDISIWGGG
jgi:hypothetical protein